MLFPRGVKPPLREVDRSLHVVPRLRINGAIILFPHISSYLAEGHFYLFPHPTTTSIVRGDIHLRVL
jgi:hypothetical protein